MKYEVSWKIEVDADTPRHAAIDAMAIAQKKDSSATVFHVVETDGGKSYDVDLGMGATYHKGKSG